MKGQRNVSRMAMLMGQIATLLKGEASDTQELKNLKREYHYASAGANPIFIPVKHTKQSYRSQQRAAQKRKNRQS